MATLPLLRGAHPTYLILAYRIAGKTNICNHPHVAIPSLSKVVELYEMLAAAGALVSAKVGTNSLNTHHLTHAEVLLAIEPIQAKTRLLCTDSVRFGA